MCSFSFSTCPYDIDILKANNLFLKKRGPDHTEVTVHKDFCSVHNLLHITGSKTLQPLFCNDSFYFFNGELYNYPKKFKSDTSFLPYLLNGVYNFHNTSDGEYSIAYYNIKTKNIYFFRDIFGTKPLYYSTENGKLLISSLKSGLEGLSNNIQVVNPNSIYRYNTKTKELNIKSNIFKFCLKQKNNTLTNFNKALKTAILKRIPSQKFCVGMSSGVDSGLLAYFLYKNKFSNFISILNNENKQIIANRGLFIGNKLYMHTFDTFSKALTIKSLLNNSEPEKYLDYNYFKDSSAYCLSYIGSYCNRIEARVYISGTGADEIYSDYGFNGEKYTDNSCFGGLYPSNLKTIFPWKNFFNGTMKDYLEKDEKILGSFGIETRYPYLDKNLVQEFLWLDVSLKNKAYKYCLTQKFKKSYFPYWIEKKGFSCEKK